MEFLNFKRAKVLAYLDENQPITVTDLADKLGWSRAKVYNYLNELESRGLVYGYAASGKKGKRVPKLYKTTDKADNINKKWFDLFDALYKAGSEK
jgi:predicted ArsR family transcriptional regulator